MTTMIAIILSTCFISDPGVCREQTVPMASEVSAARCAIKAPPYLARWSADHPEWLVVRWRCQAVDDRKV
jgi:hypothetical protein